MNDTPDPQLMIDALEHAVAGRGVSGMDGVIFHQDRGTQHMSHAFAQACCRLGITESASRTETSLPRTRTSPRTGPGIGGVSVAGVEQSRVVPSPGS